DSVFGKNFGYYFRWSSIDGTLFDDQNENGIQDNGEPGVSNQTINLTTPKLLSVHSDSLGHYSFPLLVPGSYSLIASVQAPWEQMFPQFQNGYLVSVDQYDQHLIRDFAVHKIPVRIKLALRVQDNTSFAYRDIWWGLRPGATF